MIMWIEQQEMHSAHLDTGLSVPYATIVVGSVT
jgi:hypothetical protein